jgi:uncharacterized membrane protein HdeD (DUF308 family)
LALLYLIAAWAIVTGIFEIIAAVRYADQMDNEWMLGLAGLLSILFGVLLVIRPGAGILTVLWIIGAYAVVFGILMVIAGLRARSHVDTTTTAPTAAA